MQKIKWAILGTSFISEVMAKAIQESETSQLVAIGSRSIEKANTFSTQFSIPKVYDDFQKLLNDDVINAVYIGLPNHLHKEWMIRCANAGKHVLCEKPFVISVQEAKEVISNIHKSNMFCMEALMYRYHPFTAKLQELIQSKIIGDVKLYQAFYSANIADIANPTAGGSIRNLGCYPVSLGRLLANAEPIEISGMGRCSKKNHTDNQASVILKFQDESMAIVSTADDLEMHWQFTVYGTKGKMEVITNPWLPDTHNEVQIFMDGEVNPASIIVPAEKSLYTYQIDFVNWQIQNNQPERNKVLQDSLGNAIVIESWLSQVMSKEKITI